jgi:protoporphyrinogen oxidase
LSVAIIGAGPAGLTAGYLLAKQNISVTILESDPTYVGGISKTVAYKGYRFDIGGHRFFSKSQEVEDLWTELLGPDLLVRPRSSRIFYRRKFFTYPLKAGEALRKLGLIQSLLCVLSYLNSRLFPIKKPKNFEEWVSNHFGRRLFNIFFKTYTEKVWGMDCRDISADWAAQRIKGLSLASAIRAAIWPARKAPRQRVVKSLINSFRYPRLGPGMMWEACTRKIIERGGTVQMGWKVTDCKWFPGPKTWRITAEDGSGHRQTIEAEHLISSAPMRELATFLGLSGPTMAAAGNLKYRDFVTVALILKERNVISDNWIYVHDSSVKVGRIQNFKSWSPEMVPVSGTACYGLEYFCFINDGIWNMPDEELIALGTRELESLGLVRPGDVKDGCVIRQAKAYPVYDDGYAAHVATMRAEIKERYPTLHLVGRNGMHKYNNQDHSMMTAMLTVKNIVAGRNVYDVWDVNEDAEYHESAAENPSTSGLRLTPARTAPATNSAN